MSRRLQNQVALVTGAGGGIGAAIVHAMRAEGARVLLADLDAQSCFGVLQGAPGNPKDGLVVSCDVSRAAEVKGLFQKIQDTFGRLDILVNNAGIIYEGSIVEMEEKEWDRVMAVNAKSVFLCAREAIPIMKKQRSGRIINLGSISGKTGGVNTGAYAASKAAVNCLTFALARELAPFGIRVNAVAPGFIRTALTENLSPEKKKEIVRGTPLGRAGEPADVARAVVFLAAEDSDFITGEILDINGGLLMD